MNVPLVLSVEDNDSDFSIMEMVLQQCEHPMELRRASDGEQAIAFFKQTKDKLLPALVFLDLNIPRIDGFEVLDFMKSREFIRDIPVVVFTTSSAPLDRAKAMDAGAQDFLKKPLHLENLVELLNAVCAKYLGRGASAARAGRGS
jgi:CheY-like chemotaxis protein